MFQQRFNSALTALFILMTSNDKSSCTINAQSTSNAFDKIYKPLFTSLYWQALSSLLTNKSTKNTCQINRQGVLLEQIMFYAPKAFLSL